MTPLHWFGELLRSALLLIPLPAVRTLFVGLLVGLLVWVWSLPADRTAEEAVGTTEADPTAETAKGRQWKWIATFAVAIQILIYACL